jgi:hypothetical protein
MRDDIINIVNEIDNLIRKNLWFDFYILNYDGSNLIIAGGKDLTYSHSLEIIFNEVYFVSAFFEGWHSDTSSVVFSIPKNIIDFNIEFEIEKGNEVFVFKAEDYKKNIVIAAKNISYNTDTVYYYEREQLKANERVLKSKFPAE